ncbi:MAG: sodium:solute symporter family transporter [Gemmobacter sp.]
MNQFVVSLGLLLPVGYAVLRMGVLRREDYLYHAGRTPFVQTLASIICGNIGIGSFVALFLFTAQSPLVGFVVVFAYCLGLVLCGALAARIHAAARATGSYGLIDWLVTVHGPRHPVLVWLPVAVVFGLRTVIQLLALALILQITFALPPPLALALATLVVGSYTAIGGYRVATETDLPQAVVILIGIGAIAWALVQDGARIPGDAPHLWELGPYAPGFVVAIVVFLPFSAVLAIDNWQRIATSDTGGNARIAYFAAALICAPVFLTAAWVGWISGASGGAGMAEVIATFRTLMPFGWSWLADLTIMLAVMSSIDTFVMPLITPMARTRSRMWQIRAAVVMVFVALGGVAWMLGDVVVSIISAFNTLVVFLPAVFGALVLRDRAPRATTLSMGVGVAVTLALSVVALQQAAVAGFVVSAAIYAAFRPRGQRNLQ